MEGYLQTLGQLASSIVERVSSHYVSGPGSVSAALANARGHEELLRERAATATLLEREEMTSCESELGARLEAVREAEFALQTQLRELEQLQARHKRQRLDFAVLGAEAIRCKSQAAEARNTLAGRRVYLARLNDAQANLDKSITTVRERLSALKAEQAARLAAERATSRAQANFILLNAPPAKRKRQPQPSAPSTSHAMRVEAGHSAPRSKPAAFAQARRNDAIASPHGPSPYGPSPHGPQQPFQQQQGRPQQQQQPPQPHQQQYRPFQPASGARSSFVPPVRAGAAPIHAQQQPPPLPGGAQRRFPQAQAGGTPATSSARTRQPPDSNRPACSGAAAPEASIPPP
jgi:hypothetical protein